MDFNSPQNWSLWLPPKHHRSRRRRLLEQLVRVCGQFPGLSRTSTQSNQQQWASLRFLILFFSKKLCLKLTGLKTRRKLSSAADWWGRTLYSEKDTIKSKEGLELNRNEKRKPLECLEMRQPTCHSWRWTYIHIYIYNYFYSFCYSRLLPTKTKTTTTTKTSAQLHWRHRAWW